MRAAPLAVSLSPTGGDYCDHRLEDDRMDDIVSRLIRELPDTNRDRYDIAYSRGRAQARSSLLAGGLVAGFAGGLVAMFLLDPANGRSRRAELAQRVGAVRHDLERVTGGRARDLRNRAAGTAHELGLPGTPPSNELRRAEAERVDQERRAVRAVPRSVGAGLRATDQQVDEDTVRVGVGAAAIRSDAEARGVESTR
jgi:hypothetical protein